jgi:hypothetical protein
MAGPGSIVTGSLRPPSRIGGTKCSLSGSAQSVPVILTNGPKTNDYRALVRYAQGSLVVTP